MIDRKRLRELAEALRAYQQADEDGEMVLVLRQACEEGADAVTAYEKLLEAQERPATDDALLLDAFEQWADEGFAPALVFDDDGHWQVAFEGTQPVPRGDGEGYAKDATICTFTDVAKWHATARDAIRAAIAEQRATKEK